MVPITAASLIGVVGGGGLFLLLVSANTSHVRKQPFRLPILGHALDFQPSSLLQSLRSYPRKFSSVLELYIMNMRVILVSDYERAKLVMNARPKKLIPPSEYTAKVAGSADGLFDSYGHQWSRLRRATAPSFSNQSIASHCSVVAERVYIFTKRLAQSCCTSKGSVVPIVALNNSAMVLTMEVITQVAFGFSVDDPVNTYFLAPDFLSDILNIADFVVAYLLFPLPYWLWRYLPQYWLEKKAHKASMRMRSEVLRIINHRRELLAARSAEFVSSCPKQQHPAVIDQLLARQQDTTGAHLTEEEVISNIKTIYLAGGFSTSSSISWVGFILATKPDVVTKLRAEIENTLLRGQPSETTSLQSVLSSFNMDNFAQLTYCQAFVHEIFRLHSPSALIFNKVPSGEQLQITSELTAYPGDQVWVNFEAIMRDPTVFSEPLSFQPERWILPPTATVEAQQRLQTMEASLLTFGGGPRACPGRSLVTLEVLLATVALAYAFDLTLACPASEVTRITRFVVCPNQMPLYVALRPNILL